MLSFNSFWLKFIIFLFLPVIFLYSINTAVALSQSNEAVSENLKKIAIILPIQHQAMNDIVNGFQDNLKNLYTNHSSKKNPLNRINIINYPYKIEVFNAMGNSNMLHSIILTLSKDDSYELIVPVGKTTTQMALSHIKNKPILSLATKMTEKEQKKCSKLFVVNDEVDINDYLKIINGLNYKNITIIYSNDDRIFNEVKNFKIIAKNTNIQQIQEIVVNSASEVYSLSKSISDKSEAIFIFKDHLIVSNLKVLLDTSRKKNIPIIASDEVSVISGADLALGVRERSIGETGAEVAIKILQKQEVENIEYDMSNSLLLFYNGKSIFIDKQKIEDISVLIQHEVKIIQ